MKNKIPPF